ncbi:fas apoptotic inhibitory molecule 1 isoform X1 [Aotus nancymaae]|uniref:fas apoptotic inhibitory molecule 1 isoform X1 n=1 Tax=Aotus nancymaae TaxID=37293 RepID=UPI0030FEFC2E
MAFGGMCVTDFPIMKERGQTRLFLPTMASGDDSPIFEDDESPPYCLEKMTDLVAVWDVALSDGVHKIEFEHGTTSGKRVVYVDGKEEIRKEWMFKLVGKETFYVGAAKTKATINIDAISGFAYEYTLEINGRSLKKYMENRSKTTNTWILHMDGENFRVVLEKDTMDVWCNGKKMETAMENQHFGIAFPPTLKKFSSAHVERMLFYGIKNVVVLGAVTHVCNPSTLGG